MQNIAVRHSEIAQAASSSRNLLMEVQLCEIIWGDPSQHMHHCFPHVSRRTENIVTNDKYSRFYHIISLKISGIAFIECFL